jgi:hypothetical protein
MKVANLMNIKKGSFRMKSMEIDRKKETLKYSKVVH